MSRRTNKEQALEHFQRDTQNHSMEILLDQGIYRHLKFSNNGSQVYRFDLITWPGYLAVSGDMGEYVFSRLRDMFEFFRSDKGEINAHYWAEKCEAADKNGALKSFEEDLAKAGVIDRLKQFYDDEPEKLQEALQSAEEEINYSDGEIRFYDSCRDFDSPDERHPFADFETIPDPMDWSYHYLWVCHAIAWGIQQYDAQKSRTEAACSTIA